MDFSWLFWKKLVKQLQVSSEKKPWLFRVNGGWNPTQLYGDYNEPLWRSLLNKTSIMERRRFFFVAQVVTSYLLHVWYLSVPFEQVERHATTGCTVEVGLMIGPMAQKSGHMVISSTLPETNSKFAPKNDGFQVRNLLFQGAPIFGGYVSFREGISSSFLLSSLRFMES